MLNLILSIALLSSFSLFANDSEQALERLLKAHNPFDVLQLFPGASDTEIDIAVGREVSKLSGVDLFKLQKWNDQERNDFFSATLSEKKRDAVKTVVQSAEIIRRIQSSDKLKITLFGKEIRFGMDGEEQISKELVGELKIFFEDELGRYEVWFGNARELGTNFDYDQTGYLLRFKKHPHVDMWDSSNFSKSIDRQRLLMEEFIYRFKGFEDFLSKLARVNGIDCIDIVESISK